jgi:dolichol-phosphate mannosyltransferase
LVKCNCKRVEEIPIHFADRRHGESKLTLREQFLYIKHLKRLYEYRCGRFAKPIQFALVGSSGAIVDLLCFALLMAVMPVVLARAGGIWLAMTWNFFLNRKLTFSDCNQRSAVQQYGMFCMASLFGAVVSWVTFASTTVWSHMIDSTMLAAMLGIALGAIVNYSLSRYVVFR